MRRRRPWAAASFHRPYFTVLASSSSVKRRRRRPAMAVLVAVSSSIKRRRRPAMSMASPLRRHLRMVHNAPSTPSGASLGGRSVERAMSPCKPSLGIPGRAGCRPGGVAVVDRGGGRGRCAGCWSGRGWRGRRRRRPTTCSRRARTPSSPSSSGAATPPPTRSPPSLVPRPPRRRVPSFPLPAGSAPAAREGSGACRRREGAACGLSAAGETGPFPRRTAATASPAPAAGLIRRRGCARGR